MTAKKKATPKRKVAQAKAKRAPAKRPKAAPPKPGTTITREFKGKKITVTGTGQIDLVRGEYDLHVVPRNSNPGIVSFAPEVEVSGPLEDPRFKTVKRTLVTSFARGVIKNTFKAGGALLNPFGFGRKSMQKQEEACRLTGGGDAG